jgi:hypothetical protein
MKKNREIDSIENKVNGLHSGTILREKSLGNGVVEQWHEHPETGEVVVVHTWRVQDGDCVSAETEVREVYPKQKGLVDCILSIEALTRSIARL